MARFTASVPLNIKWNGNEISGAAGATHRIPDALAGEFESAFSSTIPGFSWVAQDESTAYAVSANVTTALALKYDKTGGTISGAVTITGALVAQASVSTPSLTATTARFKGDPWYDVKAYGAVGDGTTDDTTAINAAAAAMTSGGTIYFPRGSYVFTGDQLDLLSNVHMTGAGMGASILKITTNGLTSNRRVRILGRTNVKISDITIQETGVAARTGNYGLVTIENSSRVIIDGVEVVGSSSAGVMALVNPQRFIVRNCIVRDSWADGIHCQRGARDFVISDNLLTNNGDDDIALVSHGYNTYGHVRNAVIRGNRCGEQNATLNLGSGIVVLGAIGVVVTANVIRSPRAAGIRLSAIDDGGGEIAVGGRLVVANNEIYEPISASSGNGISFSMVRDVLIADNLIVASELAAISGTSAFIDISIHGNQLRDSQAARGIQIEPTKTTTAGYLLLWTDALLSDGESKSYVFAHNLSIRGNKIGKSAYGGIMVVGNASNSIEGLVLTDNEVHNYNAVNSAGERGIYIEYAADFLARDNIVRPVWSGSTEVPVLYANITDAMQGTAVLVGGTVTVLTGRVRASANINLTRVLAGGTLGHLSVGTIAAATSFIINSSSATDTSTIYWEIAH